MKSFLSTHTQCINATCKRTSRSRSHMQLINWVDTWTHAHTHHTNSNANTTYKPYAAHFMGHKLKPKKIWYIWHMLIAQIDPNRKSVFNFTRFSNDCLCIWFLFLWISHYSTSVSFLIPYARLDRAKELLSNFQFIFIEMVFFYKFFI